MKGHLMVVVSVSLALALSASADQVTITGTVVGPAGGPAEGATVMTRYQPVSDEFVWPWPWAQTTTDAAGAFSLTLECERVRKNYTAVATKEGFSLGWDRVDPGGTIRIQLGAEPAACLGTVRDADGQPIAGAQISIVLLKLEGPDETRPASLGVCPAASAATDAVGNFRISGLPRGAEVWPATVAEGYAYKWGADEKPATVGEPFTITLQPEATVSGHVTYRGQPVEGVRVVALGTSDSLEKGPVTAADGSFAVRQLPAGTFAFTVHITDEWVARPARDVKLKSGEHRTGVDIEVFRPAVIEGTLTDARSGEPAAGGRVEGSDEGWSTTPEAGRGATSDAQGRYHMAVFPGRVEVRYRGGLERYPYECAEPNPLYS